jgi:hypothetical protein
MAGYDWIKVRTILPTDGRLRIASRKCHALPVTVFGALVTLWCLADSHADENGELIGYTADDIDALVCVPGFAAALPADWIDLSGEFITARRGRRGRRLPSARKPIEVSRLCHAPNVTRA